MAFGTSCSGDVAVSRLRRRRDNAIGFPATGIAMDDGRWQLGGAFDAALRCNRAMEGVDGI